MDLPAPTTTGSAMITSVTIEALTSTVNFEGEVGGKGKIYGTLRLNPVNHQIPLTTSDTTER
ncbi:MAG: hypothetical protein P8J33_04540 [Pirellulaceae bacterium]|nr:hypothetical protein [Pirellulaceae bacterium]